VKKTVLTLLIAAVAWADAGPYFGVGATGGSETFTVSNPGVPKREETALLQAAAVKFGYGEMEAYAIEFLLGYGRYDQNIFSTNDRDYFFFDLSLIKAFETPWKIFPFIKVGFGTGELSVERASTQSLSSGSWFGGGGVYWPLGMGFDLETSVVYKLQRWQGLDMIGAEVTTYSRRIEPYVGINWRF